MSRKLAKKEYGCFSGKQVAPDEKHKWSFVKNILERICFTTKKV
jgi:hypothetical protein